MRGHHHCLIRFASKAIVAGAALIQSISSSNGLVPQEFAARCASLSSQPILRRSLFCLSELSEHRVKRPPESRRRTRAKLRCKRREQFVGVLDKLAEHQRASPRKKVTAQGLVGLA